MDNNDTNSSRYLDRYPHTSLVLHEQIDRVVDRGLNEVQVATFKRIYGPDVFKTGKGNCPCPKCKKAV